MSLRHEETARWKKSQLPLPTSLLPVFSTAWTSLGREY
jgi:hypothetical protein